MVHEELAFQRNRLGDVHIDKVEINERDFANKVIRNKVFIYDFIICYAISGSSIGNISFEAFL